MRAFGTFGGTLAAAGLMAGLATSGALAADAAADTESMFDVAFGLALTSNYVSRGITQTEDNPAVQGYVELDYAQFYAGVWASNVSFVGATDLEADLSVGWRPEVGSFSFDLGYAHYLYASTGFGSAFGEFYGMADYSIADDKTIGAKVYFAPDYALSGTTAEYVEANADVGLPIKLGSLPGSLGVSGAVGYQVFDAAYGPSYATWNAGAYWQMNDAVKLDLRYSGTDLSTAECAGLMGSTGFECGQKVMVTLSIDSAISSLSGGSN